MNQQQDAFESWLKTHCDYLDIKPLETDYMFDAWHAALAYTHDKESVSGISDEHRTLSKWLNEGIDLPVDKKALAKVLAAAVQVPEVNEKLLNILKEYVNADQDPVDIVCRKTEALSVIAEAEKLKGV